MSQIENSTKSLVLGFFTKINAVVLEKEGLFDVSIPETYHHLFQTQYLKITFESESSKNSDYELVSPGSNILMKILNECLDFGPVVYGNLSTNHTHSPIIRFYFYVLFESVKTNTKIIFVDVDINSKEILNLQNSQITFNKLSSDLKIDSEIVDDCYVASVKFLEQNALKSKIFDFKREMRLLQKEESEKVISEYKKHKNNLQDKFTMLRSKGKSGPKLDNLISENEILRNEEKILIENIEKKYSISIDIALFASLILT